MAAFSYASRMRAGFMDEEPMKRTGLCHGTACRKKKGDTQLFRVALHRYRCQTCFKRETGHLP